MPMQEGLFKDNFVLRMIGCTAREIKEGFDVGRNGADNKLCHVDSLRYSLSPWIVMKVS